MISYKHKFIYIHIPKTGGNSIQTALEALSDDQLVFRKSIGKVVNEDGMQGLDVFNYLLGFDSPHHKHAKFSDYAAILGDDIKDFFVFASIRNPFDRLVSWTAFEKGGILDNKLSINEVIFPDSQLSYLKYCGKIAVNNYIRFENLQGDFDVICDKLNISRLKLPHKNASIRGPVQSYFDETILGIVRVRYRDEYDHFGYC